MKRIFLTILAGAAALSAVLAHPTFATPRVNGATIELRTFNDCPISTLTTTNNYPASIEITDEMNPACLGFANLHSFSFSEDGGVSSAIFNNNASFSFGADFTISGAGEGEGGLRISPWFGQLVDGRFMANATTGEIACFGGRIPFYSFTANHAITYVKGTTIRMEITYLPNGLSMADPATIQYRVIQNGMTYDSPVIPFDEGNPAENPPYGLWGILNDSRAGGYFQARANSGASLTATWTNIVYTPIGITPCADGATLELRTFNDCPISTLTTTNNYPASVEITDEMNPACLGFANLHSFSFSEDGGITPAVFNNNSSFSFGADFTISGAGEGEGGLRISPWFGQFVDGRFMANATTGEIACFGGRLPFYSFTANHAITYVKGTTIRMEVAYLPNGLSMADPATIQYRVIQNGMTYDSPVLPFDEGNPAEDPPNGLWGILNNARAGGYFQARANSGASLTATWANIAYSSPDCGCTDHEPPMAEVILGRNVLWPPNHALVEVCAMVMAKDDCDPASLISLVSVTSNEPDNGQGDGDLAGDIEVLPDNCFNLRAERAGRGDGRKYTITYSVTDASGKVTVASACVTVPHDRRAAGSGLKTHGEDGSLMELTQGGRVIVEVFNVLGRKIRTVVDQEMGSGTLSIAWDGKDDAGRSMPGGIYFTRITAPGISEIRRAVVAR